MGSDNPFGIRIEALRKSHKQETAPPEVVDEIGDRHGFWIVAAFAGAGAEPQNRPDSCQGIAEGIPRNRNRSETARRPARGDNRRGLDAV